MATGFAPHPSRSIPRGARHPLSTDPGYNPILPIGGEKERVLMRFLADQPYASGGECPPSPPRSLLASNAASLDDAIDTAVFRAFRAHFGEAEGAALLARHHRAQFVGFNPTVPVKAAGWRMEPPVSVAVAAMPSRAATAEDEPPDDPPGTRFSPALP